MVERNQKPGKSFTKEDAKRRLEKIKKDIQNPSDANSYRKFLHGILKEAGINVSIDKTIEEFNKFC